MSTDYQTTPQHQPPPLAPKTHKVRRVLLLGAAGVTVLLIGFGIGNTAHKSTVVNPTVTVTVTTTAPPVIVNKAPVTVTAPAAPAVTVTAAAPAVTVTAAAPPADTVTAEAPAAAAPPAGSYSGSDPGAFYDCLADATALSNAGDYEGAMRKNGECARLIG